MKGWISLHRKILENPILTTGKEHSRQEAFIWLLLNVNHKPAKVLIGNEVIEVKVGEKISSLKKLQKQFNWGNTRIRNFLKLLQKDGMITFKSNTSYTLIHVKNFSIYQKVQHTNNTPPTQEQHSSNKPTNTNNNALNNDINNVDIREQKFTNQVLAEGLKHTPMIHPTICDAFINHWSEKNSTCKKMKFEMEKTFEISKRLNTWIRNDEKWNKTQEPKKKKNFKMSTTGKHYVCYCECGKSDFYPMWETDKGLLDSKCCGKELLTERIK